MGRFVVAVGVVLAAFVPGATGAGRALSPASGAKIAYIAIPVCFFPEMGGCVRQATISDVSGSRVVVVGGWGSRRDRQPRWSPDGGTLAFFAQGSVYTVDQHGLGRRRLTEGSTGDWAPDGTKLVVTRGYPASIVIVNAAGRDLARYQPPLESAGFPRWSPDGTKILFTGCCLSGQRAELVVLDVASGETRFLDRGHSGSWSPDGSMVAYSSEESGSSTPGVYVIGANGAGRRRLDDGYVDDSRAWSPDGRTIAYLRSPIRDGAVYTISSDGSSRHRVTSGSSWTPTFSPDGRQIAFDRRGVGPVVMNADGTGERRIPSESTSLESLNWQPAAAELALSARGPRRAAVGRSLALPISVRNRGAAAATSVRLEVRLPATARLVRVIGVAGCRGTPTLLCSLSRVAAGGSRTITVHVRFAAAGNPVLTASVTTMSVEPNATDNRRELRIRVTGPSQ